MTPLGPASGQPLRRATVVGCVVALLAAVQFAVLYAVAVLFDPGTAGGPFGPVPWVLQQGFAAALAVAAAVVVGRGRRSGADEAAVTLVAGGLVVVALAVATANGWREVARGGGSGVPAFAWRWDHYLLPFRVATPVVGMATSDGRCAVVASAIPLAVGYPALAAGLWGHPWTGATVARLVDALERLAASTPY